MTVILVKIEYIVPWLTCSMLLLNMLLNLVKSLEDENVLESIEASFEQFQHFLDMLKELG